MSAKHRLARQIVIRDRLIAEGEPPYIICEMACAHEGKVDIAKRLVDAAVEASADAVQFELLDPVDNIVPQTEMYGILQSLYFTPDQWQDIFEHTRQYDIAISSFSYDYSSLKLALELETDFVKLNSSDLLNVDMLITLAEADIPFTAGTGSSTMMEIAAAMDIVMKHGGDKVILMHGVQNFPTDMRNAHIRRMALLRSAFDCLVGYADHTEGGHYLSNVIDLVAVGMGACVIEKHITHDRSFKGIDHESALNPDEYKNFVRVIRDAGLALGPNHVRPLTDSDRQYRQFQKKTIVAAQDLDAGATITRDNVAFLRVDDAMPELSPMDFASIAGKTLTRPVKAYTVLRKHDLGESE